MWSSIEPPTSKNIKSFTAFYKEEDDPSVTLAAFDLTKIELMTKQLDTLSKFAESPNTKIVIPAESSALLGAAQAIQSVLAEVPPATTG